MHDVRHHRRDDDCIDLLRVDPPVFQYPADRKSIFIGCPLTLRRHAEHSEQFFFLEHSHCDVRISDIYRQQHVCPLLCIVFLFLLPRQASACRFEMIPFFLHFIHNNSRGRLPSMDLYIHPINKPAAEAENSLRRRFLYSVIFSFFFHRQYIRLLPQGQAALPRISQDERYLPS